MGLGSKYTDIMSCHGYGPVDTGLCSLLKPRKCGNQTDLTPPDPPGLDGPNELHNFLETSPLGSSNSSRKNGENNIDGEVSTTSINPGLKIEKKCIF